MLWHVEIEPAPGEVDADGLRVAAEAAELGLGESWSVSSRRGILVEGDLSFDRVAEAARSVLADQVVERFHIRECADRAGSNAGAIHVLRKPGVTDPEAETALGLLRDLGYPVTGVRTVRSYLVEGRAELKPRLIERVLANDAVEEAIVGPLHLERLGQGVPYRFELVEVPIRALGDDELLALSRDRQLSLSLDEMQAIRAHFRDRGREPTDCELETIAQTWSEHCSHKTLKGDVVYNGELIENLLKQTVFKATKDLELDWLVSVFEDNAGVIRFDDEHDVCFKVETHNHPSAIEPYGGANTGLGGVIRDVLGTGLGAKPIANTDVFCVAPPDLAIDDLPPGVLHPRRVLSGVVAGVRDYGNRMGIPTVNGALVIDRRYLANPLVFCGTIGVLPKGKAFKKVEPGDLVVAIGGRTGRDGIHGATFSSIELTDQSETVSSGAVQIGNAITEKVVRDVIIQARDADLFHAITDCGAGGFSSAVGEMGAELGAEVDLEKAPLKYQGLSYTEIWISEAQERMVLAVPPAKWPEFQELCRAEDVEATALGQFVDSGRLRLSYEGHAVCDLEMRFLHDGRPKVTRRAERAAARLEPAALPGSDHDYNADLLAVLGHWDVASKEWIIRQYDHEVQGRSVIRPLVGPNEDGPSDAAVITPVRGSTRGLAISCGINPRFGELDAHAMALCCVDEAIRNCVAVGADPERIALLDNFCWGNPERPETLGSLVEAARGCKDAALAYGAPFISGKDSLYNEYVHEGTSRSIPPTLLISAMGIVPDIRECVTMDLKAAGNRLALVGDTRRELAGSVWSSVANNRGRFTPTPNTERARKIFRFVHQSMRRGLIRSCHDLSDGGLAAALAEMCLAGGLGAEFHIASDSRAGIEPAERDGTATGGDACLHAAHVLFSESPSRFLIEFEPRHAGDLESLYRATLGPPAHANDHFAAAPLSGVVRAEPRLVVSDGMDSRVWIDLHVTQLAAAWRGRSL